MNQTVYSIYTKVLKFGKGVSVQLYDEQVYAFHYYDSIGKNGSKYYTFTDWIYPKEYIHRINMLNKCGRL